MLLDRGLIMANSFVLNFPSYQGRYLQLYCTQEKDIANNRSKITWTLASIGGSSNYYDTGATTVKINGKQVYYKARTAWNSYEFPASKGSVSDEMYVSHDSKGNATISCSIESAIYTAALSSVNDNWELDAIPRAAKLIDAPDVTDETDSITISFENIAGAATEEIWFCIGNTEWGTITKYKEIKDVNASSYTYPIDEEDKVFLRRAANRNEITVRYYLRTTIAGEYHFTTLDKTLTIVNPKPLLNPSVVDVGSVSTRLTDNPTGSLIKGFNSMEYLFNASPQKEAYIVDYNLTCGGVKINNDNSNKAYNVVSGDFVFSVTDNRGNTTTVPITFDVVDYVKPSVIQSLEMEMDGETGAKIKLRIEGNYYNGGFGAVDNSLTLEVKHTQNDGSEGEWVNLNALIPEFDGNTYSLETTISGLVYDKAYTFVCRATDATGETNRAETAEYTIRLIPVFDWGENDFNFNVPVSVQGGKVYGAYVLASGSNSGTVNLNDNVSNYDYLEIYYTDNNGVYGGYSKIPTNGTNTINISLSIIEASSIYSTYIRRTTYVLRENTLTPNTTSAGYHSLSQGTVSSSNNSTNYIKILKVVGYK